MKRYWKITEFGNKYSCYVDEGDVGAIESWIEGMSVGNGLSIEVVEMTEEKFNDLPEYEG